MPKRVLDIGEMRLHVSRPDEHGHYTALSYCWGGSRFTTTRENYGDFLREIPLQEMPKTLRDAITVTWQLGFRFLWIDALCIIQDDLLDVAKEIDGMRDIYKSATVVIAAEAAAAAKQGFLEQTLPDSAVRLPVSNPDFSVQGYIWLVDDDPREEVGVSTRAWVFQEIMLARRLLIYTKHGVIWSCLSEHGWDGTPGPQGQTWLWRKYRTAKHSLNIEDPMKPKSPDDTPSYFWRELWGSIVYAYNTLELTYAGDKLPAIAGIAKEFQERTGGRYVAGLWEKELVFQLGWCVSHQGKPKCAKQSTVVVPLRQNGDGVIPSWSWASTTGQISFRNPRNLQEDTVLRVVNCDVKPLQEENIFGKVKTARLEVDAFTFPLASVKCYRFHHIGGATMDRTEDNFFWDKEYSGSYIGLYLGLEPHGSGYRWQALLIEPVGDGTYRRVGLHSPGESDPPPKMERQRLVLV